MQRSIFHGIVKNENSYTHLLYNLMLREERVRMSVLQCLLGDFCPAICEARAIGLQKTLPNGGRPDLLIETDKLSAIVEVKTEEARDWSVRQLLFDSDENEPKTYLAHLKEQATLGRTCVLLFLVPPSWCLRSDVETAIQDLNKEGSTKHVTVRPIVTWRDILLCHQETELQPGPSLWQEFQLFLKERFDLIRFSDQEISAFRSNLIDLGLATKLVHLIDTVRQQASKYKLHVNELRAPGGEISIYLQGERGWKGKTLLFGCWPALWEEGNPDPLCCATDGRYAEVFKNAVSDLLPGPLFEHDNWIGIGFSDADLKAGSDEVYRKLLQIWKAFSEAEEVRG
jgi:hypothetical protein